MRILLNVEHCLPQYFFLEVFSLYFLEEEGWVLKPVCSFDWLFSKIAYFLEWTYQLYKARISESSSKNLLSIFQIVNLFVGKTITIRIAFKG